MKAVHEKDEIKVANQAYLDIDFNDISHEANTDSKMLRCD